MIPSRRPRSHGTRGPAAAADYAPHGLVTNAASLGLVRHVILTFLGPVTVHHSVRRSSDTATVLLHGAAGSWTTWTPLLRAAIDGGQPLTDIVAIDLPGWGDSPGPDIRSRLTLDALAEAVWDVLHGWLGYARADIVGHSLGGFVGLHLAATRPASVDAVRMVSGTTFAVISSVEHPVARFGELPGFTMLLAVMRALRLLGPAGGGLVRGIRSLGLLPLTTSPLFRHPSRIDQSVESALADEVRPDAFVRAATQTRGYDARAMWSSIRCPVWATRGDADVFVTAEDFDRLADVIAHVYLTEVHDCGHFGHIERPVQTLLALDLARSGPLESDNGSRADQRRATGLDQAG